MKGVEFFKTPDGDVMMQNSEGVEKFSKENIDVIDTILNTVKENYGEAYTALQKCYGKSKLNVPFYRYRMASRFIRCNCGAYDTLKMDIDDLGRLNIEQVPCPLRGSGDCPYDGIICMPAHSRILSPRQERLASLLAEGRTNWDIADVMQISISTVHNMIQQVKNKLNIQNTGQIVAWYNRNNG